MSPRPALERLALRPDARDWRDDELVTLAEAAALFFPDGPLTANSLRIAARRGELASVRICGKTFATPRALCDMVAATPAQTPAQKRTAKATATDALERLNRRLFSA